MKNKLKLKHLASWKEIAAPFRKIAGSVILILITLLSVTATAEDISARPDYVTAWPNQVSVEKPDPVLGDKPFSEIWAYSKEFAKRFKGFPADGAETDFSPGAQAFVFRVYKEVISPGYPEQYRCEYDFYFDSSIRIFLSNKPTWVYKYKYPRGVSESYLRLDPVSEADHDAMRIAKPAPFDAQQNAVLLADGPLDGRFATHGIAYYPDLAPGLAMVRLTTLFNCTAMAPKPDISHFWLSLFGNRPYSEGRLSKAYEGSFQRGMKGSFDPGPEPIKDGYFRVPDAFYRAVLPKVTLVKALNRCISSRHVLTLDGKSLSDSGVRAMGACKEVEEHGIIYGIRYGEVVKGLQELGF